MAAIESSRVLVRIQHQEAKCFSAHSVRRPRIRWGKLVAGPDVYICNQCVFVAARLMIDPRGFLMRLWHRLRSLLCRFSRRSAPQVVSSGSEDTP